jgi:para-nitrobenzyl esterase
VARWIGRRLGGVLGVEPSRGALAAMPVDRVLQVQGRLRAELVADHGVDRWGEALGVGGVLWAHVIDGDVVPTRPIDRTPSGPDPGSVPLQQLADTVHAAWAALATTGDPG